MPRRTRAEDGRWDMGYGKICRRLSSIFHLPSSIWLSGVQKTEPLECGPGFLRRFLQKNLPAAHCPRSDVLGPIVKVKNFRAAPAGQAFNDLVKPGVGLHRAMLKRIDVAFKVV